MATQVASLPPRVLADSRTAGFIDAEGMAALLAAGFTSEVIYPVAKAYDHAPHLQENFLRCLVPILQERDPNELADFLQTEIMKIGAVDAEVRKRNLARAINGSLAMESLSVRVRVAQLIQWNRLDRGTWRGCMQNAVWACRRKGVEPVLVAYAILPVLPEIIQRIGSCYILNPGWISNPDNHWCGFYLSDSSDPVTLIGKGGRLFAGLCILDDTIKTGKTLHDLRRYLARYGNPQVTAHILWDARDPQARTFPVDGSTTLEWTEEE